MGIFKTQQELLQDSIKATQKEQHGTKLFISESKLTYSIEQIINYYQFGAPIVRQDTKKMTGILKDFKNKSRHLNLFSEKDIQKLLKFPAFQGAIEKDPNFQIKQELANAIQPDTLQLFKEISESAARKDSRALQIVTEPIKDLVTLLTRNISDFPQDEQTVRQKEREALASLTEWDFQKGDGLTTYGGVRHNNLTSDLLKIRQDPSACPQGFSNEVTNLYCLIQTNRNYCDAKQHAAEISEELTTRPKV